jgi:hypothetical protein
MVLGVPVAGASNGPTITVNPDVRQALLILESGERITMNGMSDVFSLQTPHGQTFTFTFTQLAQSLTGIPSEQQALVQKWRASIGKPGNRFTITNTHEPTLALATDSGGLPPGSVVVQGVPGITDGDVASDPLEEQVSPMYQLSGVTSSPGPCSLAPCSCSGGECWPAHGFGHGMGMIYFFMDGGGAGRATKERQNCLAVHYDNWRMQQQAHCASVGNAGVAAAVATGAAVAACSTVPGTMAATAKTCLATFATAVTTTISFINNHQACRSVYPGAGNRCG